uniref:Uncharacterized protein n=1 Tax=Anguilla anguilla TaxID=7936 RepID=A0A0E9U6N4_ANGAN
MFYVIIYIIVSGLYAGTVQIM